MSEHQKRELLKPLINVYGDDSLCSQDTIALVSAAISWIKNESLSSRASAISFCDPDIFREVLQKYGEMHKRQHLLDFDEMITGTLELLKKREDLLFSLRQR